MTDTSTEQKASTYLKRWGMIAAVVGIFSGGSAAAVFTFFAEWVEMNSRPGDVVNAADVTPGLLPLIHDNQDQIDWLRDAVCSQHPEECE